jgi:hypothetical protein
LPDAICYNPSRVEPIRSVRSKLFWRILFILVVPLTLVILFITLMTVGAIDDTVEQWNNFIYDSFVVVEHERMGHVAKAQASLFQAVLNMASRDLYILSRVSGWLMFGGVARTKSFTAVEEASEGCKFGLNKSSCVLTSKQYVSPCPCPVGPWADRNQRCMASLKFKDRRQQRRFYAGLRYDRFPEYDFSSPDFTLWWNDTSNMPGSQRGPNATGVATTYDRTRVLAAMAAVEVPIYNYAISLGRPSLGLTFFIAFNSDGFMTGFSGCEHFEATVPFFESTGADGAASVAPDLCQEGKFGYDPRCQRWYGEAIVRNETTYVSPPFRMDWSTHPRRVLILLSQPIRKAESSKYIGQVVAHVDTEAIASAFSSTMTFVVSVNSDVYEDDSVVHPQTSTWASVPQGLNNQTNETKHAFDTEILPSMRNGSVCTQNLSWTNPDGLSDNLTVAFAPVRLSSLKAVDATNFSSGTESSDSLTHSVGYSRLASEIKKPFETEKSKTLDKLDREAYTPAAVAVLFVFAYIGFICYVSCWLISWVFLR